MYPGEKPKDFLSLSEIENAIDNLEMVAYFLENISSEIKWKWAIIALHQALYGFAISSSSGYVNKSVLKQNGDLVSIWKAIDLAKETSHDSPEHFKPLVLSGEEEIAIEKLIKTFRNEFEHFKPILLGVNTSDMSRMFSHVLRVISFFSH